MSDYRRAYVPGGSYFFTLVTHRRRRLFDQPQNQHILAEAFREVRATKPFSIEAIVIWTLPRGDHDYSTRWGAIKKRFTQRFLQVSQDDWSVSQAKQRERRRGVWQRRFWEHTLEDSEDFDQHFDYIHYNPVKHHLARCPHDWKASSFHRWVERGVYSPNWACGKRAPRSFSEKGGDYGEPTAG